MIWCTKVSRSSTGVGRKNNFNKKVLLRERKRHTARRVASTCYAVPVGGYLLWWGGAYPGGGYLPWVGGIYSGWGVPTLVGGGTYPWWGVPTLGGGVPTLSGGVPTLVWGGTYPRWRVSPHPDLRVGTPPTQTWEGRYPPPSRSESRYPHHPGGRYPPPPDGGQSENTTSRHTTYAGGNKRLPMSRAKWVDISWGPGTLGGPGNTSGSRGPRGTGRPWPADFETPVYNLIWHKFNISFRLFYLTLHIRSISYFIFLCAHFYIILTQAITFLVCKDWSKVFCIHYYTKPSEN